MRFSILVVVLLLTGCVGSLPKSLASRVALKPSGGRNVWVEVPSFEDRTRMAGSCFEWCTEFYEPFNDAAIFRGGSWNLSPRATTEEGLESFVEVLEDADRRVDRLEAKLAEILQDPGQPAQHPGVVRAKLASGHLPIPSSSDGVLMDELRQKMDELLPRIRHMEGVVAKCEVIAEPERLAFLADAKHVLNRFETVDLRLEEFESLKSQIDRMQLELAAVRVEHSQLLVRLLEALGAALIVLIGGFAYIGRRLGDSIQLKRASPSRRPTRGPLSDVASRPSRSKKVALLTFLWARPQGSSAA